MSDYWNQRLAEFRQTPVVELFGVVSEPLGGWSRLDETGLCLSRFAFGAWRIGDGELQLTPIWVNMLSPESEITRLWGNIGRGGELRTHKAAHIKAHIDRHKSGFMEALYVSWVEPVDDDAQFNEIHRQLNEPITLDLPPLPPLTLDKYQGWIGRTVLASWADFCAASETNYKIADANYLFSFRTEEMPVARLGYKGVPPTPAQIAAYEYLVENDQTVRDAVLQYMFEHYPQWQEDYGGDEEYMPNITDPMQLQSLIGLQQVAILSEEKQGVAYVYFSLDPEWDIEHGFAAIVHKTRVIAAGNHDSMYQVAEQDASA